MYSTVETFGTLDVVLANAAIARLVPSRELDDDSWNDLLDINLAGVFRLFRAALPYVVEARWGRLLATSSITGPFMGWPEHVHYTAAKRGAFDHPAHATEAGAVLALATRDL